MPPSPDRLPAQPTPKSRSSQKQQRRHKSADVPQSTALSIPKAEDGGGGDRYGERINRVLPREISASRRKPSTSTSPPQHSHNATASPLLAALGTTSATARNTSEWARSLPFFATSPSSQHPISITGSPPNLSLAHFSRDGSRGHTPSSQSPPIVRGRPFSFPKDHSRRLSMYSQTGHRSPFQVNPPLPHEAQPHFYGTPELDYGLDTTMKNAVRPGEGFYYCGLDSLSDSGIPSSSDSKNVVVLVGYEGGIDVLRLRPRSLDVVARLEGLRGSVIGARIIPTTGRSDQHSGDRPLVALIVHGPKMRSVESRRDQDSSSQTISDEDENNKTRGIPEQTVPAQINEYQTTVEVYSLYTPKHIATLLECPPTTLASPLDSPLFQAPPPTGDLRLSASGKHLVVSSGTSGEVFMFSSHMPAKPENCNQPPPFRCMGKLWTVVQPHRHGSTSSATSSTDISGHEKDETRTRGVPLLTLSSRWLAVVPPMTAQKQSINAIAYCMPDRPSPPGISQYSAPPPPNETCAVDVPQDDTYSAFFAREGTQIAMSSAKWAADQTKRAYNHYRGQPTQTTDTTSAMASPYGANLAQQFPPTHAQPISSQQNDESNLVSIYDLTRLFDYEQGKRKNALDPISSFSAKHGISHLSFSPSGIMLLTVSRKGDVQDVWNLFRITNKKARRTLRGGQASPHARQVVRFTRMTAVNVVEAAWSPPNGGNLAILTEHGTVHLYPMPSAAFQWPYARPTKHIAAKTIPETNEPSGAVASVTSAWRAVSGTARSMIRRQSDADANHSPGFGISLTGTVGSKSAKTAARQFGQSLGTTAQNFVHAGDNKIKLSIEHRIPAHDSIQWLVTKQGRTCLAITTHGNVEIYSVSLTPARGKQQAARVRKGTAVCFELPDIRGGPFPPWFITQLDEGGQEVALEGLCTLKKKQPPTNSRSKRIPKKTGSQLHSVPTHAHPLSFADLETSAPYLPSHTDTRVALFHTTSDGLQFDNGSVVVFGTELHGRRVLAERASYTSPEGDDVEAGEGSLLGAQTEQRIVKRDDGFEEIEITTHTRRRRRGDTETDAEDDEGIFEEDCTVIDFAEDRV